LLLKLSSLHFRVVAATRLVFLKDDSKDEASNKEHACEDYHPDGDSAHFGRIVGNVRQHVQILVLARVQSLLHVVDGDVHADERHQFWQRHRLQRAWLQVVGAIGVQAHEHDHGGLLVPLLREARIWLQNNIVDRVDCCMLVLLALDGDLVSLLVLNRRICAIATVQTLLKERHVEGEANIDAAIPLAPILMDI